VGVVPQFRYMEHWYELSILQDLYQRLEHLFERRHRYFPTIMTRLQEHPEAFSQFCEAFAWFLEQVQKRSDPSRRSRRH